MEATAHSNSLPGELHPFLLTGDGDLITLVCLQGAIGVGEMNVALGLFMNWNENELIRLIDK